MCLPSLNVQRPYSLITPGQNDHSTPFPNHLSPTFPASVHLDSLFLALGTSSSCLSGKESDTGGPLPAAHLGVSVFGLMSVEQNKPGSVTVPLKPKELKPTQQMLLTGGVPEISAGL